MRLYGAFIFLSLIIFFNPALSEEKFQTKKTGIYLDTLGNEILLCLDSVAQPLHYYSEIFTPVCHVGECLPIKINLFWTLAGNYLKYSMPEGEILTKVDHIPFTQEDYLKLDAILKNKLSTLRYLMNKPKVVDGTTGPTQIASSRDYVSGAIYTSLTLYEFIYGGIKNQLVNYSEKNIIDTNQKFFFLNHADKELAELTFMYLQKNQHEKEYGNFLIKGITQQKFNHEDIAVRFIPQDFLKDFEIQNKLIPIYSDKKTDVKTRTYLLEMLQSISISDLMQQTILLGFKTFQSDFELILQIINHQIVWSERIYVILKELIEEESNMKRKDTLLQLLKSRSKTAPKEVKKFLKKYL